MKRYTSSIKILQLIITFFLLFQPNFLLFSNQTILARPENISMGNSVWMHIDTFFQQNNTQINNFVLTLKIGNINNVIILAKNIDGTITYPSAIGVKSYSNDFMSNFVKLMKSSGIKVYFYFPINTDPSWLTNNKQDIAYQVGTKGSKIPTADPEKKLINLTSKRYRNYIVKLVEEAINKYSIDGVQLDYIRYSNGLYGFSKEELTEAKQRKISITKIIDFTYQTFIDPGDWNTILKKYDEADPDVLAWAKLRKDIVYDFTLQIANSVKYKNIQIGSTLVSSGANAEAYTAIHFGQNWEKMSSILNFVTPMAYHGSRNDVKKFVGEICLGAIAKIKSPCKIAIGIQANSTTTEKMMDAIQTTKKFNLGFVLFRIGTFAFSSFDFFPLNKDQTVLKLIIHNNIEGKQIKGFEIRNTGNILTLLNSPVNFQLRSQNETSINFFNKKAITYGELLQFEFNLNWNWEKSKTIFAPTLIVSDEKNEFPTLNVAFFSIDQVIIDLNKQNTFYKGQILQKNIVKIENQKSWISIDGLNQIFGFEVEIISQQIVIRYKNSQLIVTQSNKMGQFFLEGQMYLLEDQSFFSNQGYLPLKELMNLFRIHISYNMQEKKVFCSSLTRDIPGSVFGTMNNLSPLELWISDASEVLIDLEDFLSNSFYSETFKNHVSGRRLRIIIKNGKYSFLETEKIIHLITDEIEKQMIPDTFSYFISQNTNWKLIPINREIFTDSQEIAMETNKIGYPSILLINKFNYSSKSSIGKVYFDMSDQNIIDKINMIQFESKNARSLFFLTNLKF
jgi:uncharacterized lipoprotein YddW (UPF0748 family)